MKWILILLGIALAALAVVSQRGGMKAAYVNGLPGFNKLPGREFILQRDCYVYADPGNRANWPYLGDNARVPGLPAQVSADRIGTRAGELEILDVVRVGARFRILSVRREERRTGTTYTYEVLLTDDAPVRRYPRLDTRHLLDHAPGARGEPPAFLEAYAVERVRY